MLARCTEILGRCEVQLRSDCLFLVLHGQADGVQNQIYRLLCSGFVSDNGIVIEIPDHGQVQHALPGVDVGSASRIRR